MGALVLVDLDFLNFQYFLYLVSTFLAILKVLQESIDEQAMRTMLLSANQQSGARDQAKAFFHIVPSSHFYLMVTHLLRVHVFWRFHSLNKNHLSAFLIPFVLFMLKI